MTQGNLSQVPKTVDTNLTNHPLNDSHHTPLLGKVGTGAFALFSVCLFFILQIWTLFLSVSIVLPIIPEKQLHASHFYDYANDGTILSVSLILNLVALAFYCCLMLKIRHKKFFNYLSVKSFQLNTMFICIGWWVLYVIATEVLFYLTSHQPMDFMDVYFNSAEPLWLLILGIVIIAPIYEELVFRGLLWRAIAEQFGNAEKRGAVVASVVTGLLFAGVHMQYDIYEMSTIFALALILGFARYRSGSLWLPILLHVINNGVSMGMYVYAS